MTTRNPRRAYDNYREKSRRQRSAACARSASVRCWQHCDAIGCGHEAILTVDGLSDDRQSPMSPLRLRCTRFGGRDVRTRPDWREMHAAGMPPETRNAPSASGNDGGKRQACGGRKSPPKPIPPFQLFGVTEQVLTKVKT